MSAKPQFLPPDELLPSVDYPAPFEGALEPEPKVANGTPAPAVRRATASNLLSAIQSMSEEEKIALFS